MAKNLQPLSERLSSDEVAEMRIGDFMLMLLDYSQPQNPFEKVKLDELKLGRKNAEHHHLSLAVAVRLRVKAIADLDFDQKLDKPTLDVQQLIREHLVTAYPNPKDCPELVMTTAERQQLLRHAQLEQLLRDQNKNTLSDRLIWANARGLLEYKLEKLRSEQKGYRPPDNTPPIFNSFKKKEISRVNIEPDIMPNLLKLQAGLRILKVIEAKAGPKFKQGEYKPPYTFPNISDNKPPDKGGDDAELIRLQTALGQLMYDQLREATLDNPDILNKIPGRFATLEPLGQKAHEKARKLALHSIQSSAQKLSGFLYIPDLTEQAMACVIDKKPRLLGQDILSHNRMLRPVLQGRRFHLTPR